MERFFSVFCIFIGITLFGAISVNSHRLPGQAAKETTEAKTNTVSQESQHSVQEHASQEVSKTVSKTSTDTQTQTEAPCQAACRPQWLSLVTTYLGTVKSNRNPMCQFTTLFSACGTAQKPGCSSRTFVCCPLSCLKEVNACWQGTDTNNICIPDQVPPAWGEKMAMEFSKMMG